jgi:hypothetical protein
MHVISIYRVCSQKCWYRPTKLHGVKNFLKDFKNDLRSFPVLSFRSVLQKDLYCQSEVKEADKLHTKRGQAKEHKLKHKRWSKSKYRQCVQEIRYPVLHT